MIKIKVNWTFLSLVLESLYGSNILKPHNGASSFELHFNPHHQRLTNPYEHTLKAIAEVLKINAKIQKVEFTFGSPDVTIEYQ